MAETRPHERLMTGREWLAAVDRKIGEEAEFGKQGPKYRSWTHDPRYTARAPKP